MDQNKDIIQNAGLIQIYKNNILGSKWKEVYAILYSDSTLKWFSKKGGKDPKGFLILKDLIPFICIGQQIDKLPSKRPKIQQEWTNSLIAIATDQKASKIYWFCFETTVNLKKWLQAIISTLPKLNPPAYEEKDKSKEAFDEELTEPPPYEDENAKNEASKKEQQQIKKKNVSKIIRTLDDTLCDYGFGRSFYYLTYFGLDGNPLSHHSHNDDGGHNPPIHHTTHHHHHNGDPSHKHHHNGIGPMHHNNPKLQTTNTGPSASSNHHHHHKHTTNVSNGTTLGITAHHQHHHHAIGVGTSHNHHHHHVTHHHTSHSFGHFGGHHGGHHGHF